MNNIYTLPNYNNIDDDGLFLIYNQDDFIYKIQKKNIIFDLTNTYIEDDVYTNESNITDYLSSINQMDEMVDAGSLSSIAILLSTSLTNDLSSINEEIQQLSQLIDELTSSVVYDTVGKYKKRSPQQYIEKKITFSDMGTSSLSTSFAHGLGSVPQRIEFNMKRIQNHYGEGDDLNTTIHDSHIQFLFFSETLIIQDGTNVQVWFPPHNNPPNTFQGHHSSYEYATILKSTRGSVPDIDYATWAIHYGLVLQTDFRDLLQDFEWTFKIYKNP